MSERKPQKRKPPSDTGNPCEAHVSRAADGATADVIAWKQNDKNSPAKKAALAAARKAARAAAEEAAKEAARAAAGKAAQKAARAAEKAELTKLEYEARTTATNATRCKQQLIQAKKMANVANTAATNAATNAANAAAANTAAANAAATNAANADANAVLADFTKLCAGQEAYELQKALVAAAKSASAVYYAAINAAVNSAAAASAAALVAANAFTKVGSHSAALAYFEASKVWLNI
jgi:colicin import membrane protein